MAVSVSIHDHPQVGGVGGMVQVAQVPMMNASLPLQTQMQPMQAMDHFNMQQQQHTFQQVPITQVQGNAQPLAINTAQNMMQSLDMNNFNQPPTPTQTMPVQHLPGQPQVPMVQQPLTPTSPTNPALQKAGSASGMKPDIKTVFVAGLPHDATDRELYLLFGAFEGYDKSMIVRKDNGKRPYGFVNFINAQTAEDARNRLDGFQWNPNDPLKLKIELSKRNTPDWFNATCASPSSVSRRLSSLPKSPKTLYITGVPESVSKELFDAFIITNFEGQVGGLRYTLPTDKKSSFAFVGFNSHEQAKTAMERLDGYVWTHEGVQSTIRATPANTEWDPRGEV
eukprot:TRINITY_DN3915_c0_g2_i1.p1 TRINITY_DN3915_c0_g2~~TRINITY_DN3915_c0_g2_i1.p1  ORF type:complete len:369 (+),score=91.96 TRINITY_DN3915_c0_g2_i1:94-1107(+)